MSARPAIAALCPWLAWPAARRRETFFLLALAALALTALNPRWWERLLLPPVTLSWTVVTSEDALYSAVRFDPFDSDVNGSLFPLRDVAPLSIISGTLAISIEGLPSSRGGDRLVLQAVVSPAVHHGSQETRPLSLKTRRAVSLQRPDLDPDTLVEWDLHPFATQGWTPVELPNTGRFLVAEPGADASLSLDLPVPRAYLLFLKDPRAGLAHVSGDGQGITLDLHEPSPAGDWALVPLESAHRPAVTRRLAADITGAREVRLVPLRSETGEGLLQAVTWNDRPIDISSAQTWQHGEDITLYAAEDGLRIAVTGPDAWIALPSHVRGTSTMRATLALLGGAVLLCMAMLIALALAGWLTLGGGWLPTPAPARAFEWAIPLGLAGVLHLSYFAICAPIIHADGRDYLLLAGNLSEWLSNGSFRFYRTPVYVGFQWLFLASGGGIDAIVLAQHLLACGSVYLTWRIGWRLGLGRWAMAPAILVACNPYFHWYAQTMLSETLTMFLLLATANLLLAAAWRGHGWSVALGLTAGLLVLCRPQYMYLVPLVCVLVLLRPGMNWRSAAGATLACLVGLLLLIVPWRAYNGWRGIDGLAGAGGYGLLGSQFIHEGCAVEECPPLRLAMDRWRADPNVVRGRPNFHSWYLYQETRRPTPADDVVQVRALHKQLDHNSALLKTWGKQLYQRYPRRALRFMAHTLAGYAGLRETRYLATNLAHPPTGEREIKIPGAVRAKINQALAAVYPWRLPFLAAGVLLGLGMAVWERRLDACAVAALGLGNIVLMTLILRAIIRYVWPVEPLLWILAMYGLHRLTCRARRQA